jgi:hypothetical protein
MTRLRHSPGGLRRRFQIGITDVVLVAEGKTDRYFYSKLLGHFCQSKGVSASVVIARELPDGAGGKQSLLAYHDYLRKKGSLCSTLAGKKTLVVFLADKDVDDLARRKRRSAHILYTQTYDYENYLFLHGNVVEAGAAAAGLDVMSVAALIPDHAAWVRRAAEEWKEWIKVCVFAIRRRITRGGTYGIKSSPINGAPYSGIDNRALAARQHLLRTESRLTPEGFRRAWRRVSKTVDELYALNRQDEVFKGKWYSWFLAEDLRRAAAGRDANLDSLERRIPHHVAMTLDYEQPWSAPVRASLEGLLQACGLVPTP